MSGLWLRWHDPNRYSLGSSEQHGRGAPVDGLRIAVHYLINLNSASSGKTAVTRYPSMRFATVFLPLPVLVLVWLRLL